MARLRTVRAFSAGGVVHRLGAGGPEFALCGRGSPRIWALPKGTPRPGERAEETALREVAEETGLAVQLVAPLDDIEYWFVAGRQRCHKTVRYYLMRAVGGDVSRHDREYEEVVWFPGDEAERLLTYENERRVLRLGREQLVSLADQAASREAAS